MTLGDRVAVMRGGVLQQVDTPRVLYNSPVNIFVAGFIGSPAMNFFAATVKGGKLALPFATVPAPDSLGDAGDVIVGIRPEDFEDARFAPDGRAHGVEFDAPIDVARVDGLGDLRLLLLRGRRGQLRRARRARARLRRRRDAGRRRGQGRRAAQPGVRHRRRGQGAAVVRRRQAARLRPGRRHEPPAPGGQPRAGAVGRRGGHRCRAARQEPATAPPPKREAAVPPPKRAAAPPAEPASGGGGEPSPEA